jgi:hypothetical protein
MNDDLDRIRFGQKCDGCPSLRSDIGGKYNLFEVYFPPLHKGLH